MTPIEEIANAAGAEEIDEAMRTVMSSYGRLLPGDRRRLLKRFRYVHAARKLSGSGASALEPGSCCWPGGTPKRSTPEASKP